MYRKRRRITLLHRESPSSIFIILFEITKGKNKILFRSIIYNLKAFNSVRDKIYPVSVEYKGKWYILMHNKKSNGMCISDFRGKYYMTCKRSVDPNYIYAEFIKREWNEESFIIIKAYNKTFLWGFKRQKIYYSRYNEDIGYISGSDEPIYKFPEEGYCTGKTDSLEDWKSDWLE